MQARTITALALSIAASCPLSANADVELDGRNVTPEAIARIAHGEPVRITSAARERVAQSHKLLLDAARQGQQIYGLTVGVGENKDREMVDASGQLTPAVIDASRRFNMGLLRSHGMGTGPDASVEDTRAAMAARLNGMLAGGSGVQPSVVEAYAAALNAGITPAMPAAGSVGEADITLLAHIGIGLMGEGDAYYGGRKQPAAQALKAAGIKPIQPFGKDGLSILSSNAYSAGMAALALHEMDHLNRVAKQVYALSLQALNGNVSPFLEDTLALRPFPQTVRAGADLRRLLNGSSLWAHDAARPLQDPLSYRTTVYSLGELDRAAATSRALIDVQLNSSDDNPGVALGVRPKSNRAQESHGYLDGGAVLPSANFEPLPWVLAFEGMGTALAQHGLTVAQRVVKLNDTKFTGLPRFLGTETAVQALAEIEKPATALAMEIKALAQPVSLDYLPMAGNIEDVATNAPAAVQRVRKQIDNTYALLAIEAVQAAQAIDLRRRKTPGFTLSPATQTLYDALRARAPFIDQDRALTDDFRAAKLVLQNARE